MTPAWVRSRCFSSRTGRARVRRKSFENGPILHGYPLRFPAMFAFRRDAVAILIALAGGMVFSVATTCSFNRKLAQLGDRHDSAGRRKGASLVPRLERPAR